MSANKRVRDVWFLSAALLCLLIVRGNAQSSCGSWTSVNNTGQYGGIAQPSITNVDDCKRACENNGTCTGVDWNANNPQGQQCYMLFVSNGTRYTGIGVTHYEFSRTCASSCGTWTQQPGSGQFGGIAQSNITNQDDCRKICESSMNCTGIDWSPNNPQGQQCFLLFGSGTRYNGTGVTHSEFARTGNCSGLPATPGVPGTGTQWTTLPSPGGGGEGCQWITYSNSNIFGGTENSASTVADCQAACTRNATCQGVDFVPNNPDGKRCYILATQNGRTAANWGVTHYDYVCNGSNTSAIGAGSVCVSKFEVNANQSSLGAVQVPEIRDFAVCFLSCNLLTNCLGFEYSPTTYCWMHFNSSDYTQFYAQDATQLIFRRCPEEGLINCMPAYNGGTLTNACATACIPKWARYDDMVGSGGQSFNTIQAGNLTACLSACFNDNIDCIGVDWIAAPGNTTTCIYYGSGQRTAMQNLTSKPFSIQYRLTNRCAQSCTAYYELKDNVRYRLINGTVQSGLNSEDSCRGACNISPTCEAYQWSKNSSSSCILADNFFEYSGVADTSVKTSLWRLNCTGASTFPPTPLGTGTTGLPNTAITPLPGGCQWITYNNSNIFGGTENPASTVADCQAACIRNTTCKGVDFVPNNPDGKRCYILATQNGRTAANWGVTHYDYVCNSSSSSSPSNCFTQYPNMNIFGGTENTAPSLDSCKNTCLTMSFSNCQSIDWVSSNQAGKQCYILKTQTGRNPANWGVDHYDRSSTC